jgi:hypothetical protein
MECARRFLPRSPVLLIMDMTLVVAEPAAFPPPPLLWWWLDEVDVVVVVVDNDARGGDEYECRSDSDRGWHSLGGLRGWSRNGDHDDDEAVSADAVPGDDKLAARGRCLLASGFVDARVPEAVGEDDGAEFKKGGVGKAEPIGEEPSPAASPPAEGDNGRELEFRPVFRDESRDAEEEEEDEAIAEAEAAPAGGFCMTITLTGGLKAAPCPSTSPSRRFARWFRKGSGRQVLGTRFLESTPPTSSEPAAQGKLLHPPVPAAGSCLRGDSCERISPSPEEDEQGQEELSRSWVRGEPGDASRTPLTMVVVMRRERRVRDV